MAGSAVIYNSNVIKGRRKKAGGDVTLTTIITSGYMGSMHAFGGNAIMARNTAIHDASMIKDRGRKGTGYVTDTAVFLCRKMSSMFAERYCPIVTGIATNARHCRTGMVDKSTCKISRVMTNRTVTCSNQVRSCFFSGSCRNVIAVMT